MMETVMVLVVFFIIVVLGFIMYSKMQESSINQLKKQMFEEESVAIAQSIIYLPELQCSDKSVLVDVCFDMYKLNAFSEAIKPQNRDVFLFYQRDFRESKITVKEIFPFTGPEMVLYNNTPIDMAAKSSILTRIPVSLKNPAKRYAQYSIGILDIEVYG